MQQVVKIINRLWKGKKKKKKNINNNNNKSNKWLACVDVCHVSSGIYDNQNGYN